LEPGTTKNDEGRTFPFAALPQLKALLEKQREKTDAIQREMEKIIPWVFHRGGKRIKSFRKAWHKAVEAAKIAKRKPHDFRRTAVRNLERAGVPRSVAMKLTGHKTESIYRRYTIVSEDDLAEGVAKLAARHNSQSEMANRVYDTDVVLLVRTHKIELDLTASVAVR
jgi:integrase